MWESVGHSVAAEEYGGRKMVLLLRLLAAAVAAAALQGCASFRGAPLLDPKQTLQSSDPLYDGYVKKFFAEETAERRMAIRDEFITVRMGQIDRAHGDYKKALHSQRSSTAVGLDAVLLTLAAVAATVSDAGTSVGAAALTGVFVGSRASVDKNVFFDQALPAIFSQMDARRDVFRGRLFAGMLLSDTTYRLADADSDLSQYQEAGTVYGAVAAITSQAGQAKAQAEKVLRDRLPTEAEIRGELTTRGFRVERAASTTTTELLKKCLVPPQSVLDPKIEKQFDVWFETAHPEWLNSLPKDKKPPSSITPQSDFMTVGAYEPLRKQAFGDATLGPLLRQCNHPPIPAKASP